MSQATVSTSALVEGDAHEFGLHLKQGGWRLGLLVARSVSPGEGQNERDSRRRERDDEKVSSKRFAADAGTTADRVLRYYRAWQRAAMKGVVPPANELAPGDEPDIDWERLPRWKTFFNPTAWDESRGATGPLNLRVKLGHYGDRLFNSHKRLIHFVERELPEQKAGKDVRELAGRYAACHEAEAHVLRKIEAGEPMPPKEELEEILDPRQFFEARS